MLTNIYKHPGTTIVGILGVIAQVLLNGRTWGTVVVAILAAVLGASKDPWAPTQSK